MSVKKRLLLAAGVLILLAALLPPMLTAGLFKDKIRESMSRALGREVTIGNTSLRVVPLGFNLENVTIAEDPAFGYEPVIRAEEVTASIRFASLWRGRLEVAKLHFKYPSINLVRAEDGRWNVSSLVARTSQTPSAPTGKTRSEARPRFPYIETDTGRLNFKFGVEKKTLALLDADIALWQESDNEWRARIAARPVRTDSNLSDTGLLRLDARFGRAAQLQQTPFDLRVTWDDAQLGQLTALVYGRDRGWRGGTTIEARLAGTPEALTVTANATVDDFRRFDIYTTERFRIAAQCVAKYSSTADRVSEADCKLPTAGNGLVQVKGTLEGVLSPRAYDLSIEALRVPAQALVQFARHAKRDIPDDLAATGALEAALTVRKIENANAVWQGGGTTTGVVLTSRMLDPEVALGNLRFGFQQPQPAPAARRARPLVATVVEPRLVVTPFVVNLGGTAPATASATFAGDGYRIDVDGDADVPRALQVARVLGMPTPVSISEGKARLNLAVVGEWAGLPEPVATGVAQLREVRAEISGLTAPLQLAEATLKLDSSRAALEQLTASFTGIPMNFTGEVSSQRGCVSIGDCDVRFDLRADSVSPEMLYALLNPNAAPRPWYRILTSAKAPNPALPTMRAQGKLAARRAVFEKLEVEDFSAAIDLSAGVLTLGGMTGRAFGGALTGTWTVDFKKAVPTLSGSGELRNVAVASLSGESRVGTGTMTATYSLATQGWHPEQLLENASGTAKFDIRNGELRKISLDGTPLRFTRVSGNAALEKSTLTLSESRMATRRGILQLSGTATLGRQLDLRVDDGKRAMTVRGDVASPQVSAVPEQVSQSQP